MTFGEIYNKVCQKVWGSSPPPTIASALTGQNGIISDIHRKIQQNYNYWFMQAYATIVMIDGTQAYNLPSEFKEIINCLYKIDGQENFTDPLTPLGLGQGQLEWKDEETEYPTLYEIVNGAIVLYPRPSEARTLHVNYWQFLRRPTDAEFTTYEDALSQFGYEVMINLSVVEIADILKEFDLSQRFDSKALEALDLLKTEDRSRRQNHIAEILYQDV